jgi:putative flippase GtrA
VNDMTVTTPQRQTDGPGEPRAGAVLDVVIPVYNEETDLARCVTRLHEHLAGTFPYPFQITIADNASTDRTLNIALGLSGELSAVRVMHLPEKGRGRALHAVWSRSTAQVLAYMDVDLSTDLAALLPLVAPLISGHSDLAIGSRLARGSRVVRGFKREAISRGYNLLLRGTLAARFSDAQCGFKAIRKDVAEQLLPLVRDTGWFFDTELLVLAERAGLRIHEVPVDWVDDPDSRVDIVATAVADLRGIARLGRALATGALPLGDLRHRLGRPPLQSLSSQGQSSHEPSSSGLSSQGLSSQGLSSQGPVRQGPLLPGLPAGLAPQLLRFIVIGVTSTLAYLALYFGLRQGMPAQAANLLALLATAVVNTAANRRLTFGVTGRRHAGRHHLQGLFVFGLGLALTSGSLVALHAVTATPPAVAELSVLVTANLVGTVLRFVLLRHWLFHRATA